MKKLCIFVCVIFLICCVSNSTAESLPLIGLTIDDAWYDEFTPEEICNAIAGLPYRPTVRVVMNGDSNPEDYVPLFRALQGVADIMACPVDSYEMIEYTSAESYRERFVKSYAHLSPYVSVWEIGNEISGEGWMGSDRQLIADKMLAAYKYIHAQGAQTALTAYYTKPKQQEMEMLDWLKRYVPQDMAQNLDYLLVSYYEDDNEQYVPDWQNIFESLEQLLPNAKLAIGECGVTKEAVSAEEKIARILYYYTMPRYTKNYVGGYFWWYWVQDCLPIKNNPIYDTFQKLPVQLWGE